MIDAVKSLWNLYQNHVYLSGYLVQRDHSGPDGKKLLGKKRPDWKRIYMELQGDRIYRWEAGDLRGNSPEIIERITAGDIDKESVKCMPPIDIASTEISWIGIHRSHRNIRNLTVVEGITGSDKTYWNFSSNDQWLRWRDQLSKSRAHRRLILTQHLAVHFHMPCEDEEGASLLMDNLTARWTEQEIERCSVELCKQEIVLKSRKTGKLLILQDLRGLYLRIDGSIELLGLFKSSKMVPEKVHLVVLQMPQGGRFPLLFIKHILGYPQLAQCSHLVTEAQQADDLLLTEIEPEHEEAAPVKDRSPTPPEISEASRKSQGDLESMFSSMLPVLIEDSPFDSVPVEFFYKALVNAWDAAGVHLIPSPQTISNWMTARSYRTALAGDREVWLGFHLRPINYELYKRRHPTGHGKIEEII